MKTIKILLFISLSAFALPGGKSQKVEPKKDSSMLKTDTAMGKQDSTPWPDSANTGKLRKSMKKADEMLSTGVTSIIQNNDQLARENDALKKALLEKNERIAYLEKLPPDTILKQPIYPLTRIIFSKDSPVQKKSKTYQAVKKETGTSAKLDTGTVYYTYSRG